MIEPFKQFLSLKGRVQSKYLPFYLRWVIDCYRFLDIPLSQFITNEQKSQFLKQLGKSHEDWQVNQADHALRLYGYFLSRTSPDENGRPSATMINDWKAIEEKTIEAIRLRHRSYSTEKTYVTWLRQFQSFIKNKNPNDLDGKALQDFLSYLAVEKKVSSSTQNQALNAIVFVYRHVLDRDIEDEINSVRARQRTKDRYRYLLHAYCLMTNHYHLLLETPQANLSQIMQNINTSYPPVFDSDRHILAQKTS